MARAPRPRTRPAQRHGPAKAESGHHRWPRGFADEAILAASGAGGAALDAGDLCSPAQRPERRRWRSSCLPFLCAAVRPAAPAFRCTRPSRPILGNASAQDAPRIRLRRGSVLRNHSLHRLSFRLHVMRLGCQHLRDPARARLVRNAPCRRGPLAHFSRHARRDLVESNGGARSL